MKESKIMEEEMVKLIDKAHALAIKMHDGQFDKVGRPYIEHPEAVSNLCKTNEEKIVGLLHDIVEDTPMTLDDLRKEGFPENIVNAVDLVTRKCGQTNNEYYANIKKDPIARNVKIADLTHNTDESRWDNFDKEKSKDVWSWYLENRKKYQQCLDMLKYPTPDEIQKEKDILKIQKAKELIEDYPYVPMPSFWLTLKYKRAKRYIAKKFDRKI